MTRPIAIITGAAGGMGREIARRWAGRLRLVLVDVDQGRLETLRDEIDGDAACHAVDFVDPDAVAKLADAVGDGHLARVAHTAGVSPGMTDPRRILAINLGGTVALNTALLPRCHDGTVFVAVASMAGHGGDFSDMAEFLDDPLRPGAIDAVAARLEPPAAYAVSKFGVIRLVERQAAAWGARGGRIVSVSPGWIDTPMARFENERTKGAGDAAKKQPVPRLGTPADIADAVDFLVSDKASFITGTDLLVDGGSIALQRGDPAYAKAMAIGPTAAS